MKDKEEFLMETENYTVRDPATIKEKEFKGPWVEYNDGKYQLVGFTCLCKKGTTDVMFGYKVNPVKKSGIYYIKEEMKTDLAMDYLLGSFKKMCQNLNYTYVNVMDTIKSVDNEWDAIENRKKQNGL